MEKKKQQLTVKQNKFCRNLVQVGNATESVLLSGYDVKDRKTAKSLGANLLQNPKIQSHVAKLLDEMHPNIDRDAANWVSLALQAPIKGSADDVGAIPPMDWSTKKAFLELLSKWKSWDVKKSAHLRADITEFFKLPK